MVNDIPDGEYDLDFSGLFRTKKDDIFGLKYGFKPDTIDDEHPSQLHIDSNNNWYLASKSKMSAKAVTPSHNEHEKIYFMGTSGHSIAASAMSASGSSLSASSMIENMSISSINDLLLSFDSAGKKFHVNSIENFVKMTKSREPKRVHDLISKIRKTSSSTSQSPFIDSFMLKVNQNQGSQKKAPKSPIRIIDPPPIASKQTNKKVQPGYNKLLSKISPVRRSTPIPTQSSATSARPQATAYKSPTPNLPSPTKLHSGSSPTTASKRPPPPRLQNSPAPTSRPIGATGNGGTGVRKPQKSLLLRKAERAVGINNGAINKPRREITPSIDVRKTLNTVNAVRKQPISKQHMVNLIPERKMKESRPEQTTFELVLTPPVANFPNLESPTKSEPDSKYESEIKSPMSLVSDEDFENFADELELEMNEESEVGDAAMTSQEPVTTKRDSKVVSDSPESSVKQSTMDVDMADDDGDFDMDFSDWDDTDAVNEVNPNTAGSKGISGFNLIIEDDPLKNIRDNEKELERRRQQELKEKMEFEREVERRQQEKKLQEKLDAKKSQQAQARKAIASRTAGKTVASKTVPRQPTQTQNQTQQKLESVDMPTAKRNASTSSINQDRELEAELDKAFDDIQFDEDMSEEE